MCTLFHLIFIALQNVGVISATPCIYVEVRSRPFSMLPTVPKWRSLRWNLSFWAKEEVTRTQIGRAWWLLNNWNNVLVKNSFTEMALWQGALSLCSIQVSACPVRRPKFRGTVWRFKFNALLIIPTVKRLSDLTRSLTLVTFSSVFDVQSLPEAGSSSTPSRPSKNILYHLETCVLDRACSP